MHIIVARAGSPTGESSQRVLLVSSSGQVPPLVRHVLTIDQDLYAVDSLLLVPMCYTTCWVRMVFAAIPVGLGGKERKSCACYDSAHHLQQSVTW